jgi:hypothetical protein
VRGRQNRCSVHEKFSPIVINLTSLRKIVTNEINQDFLLLCNVLRTDTHIQGERKG